MKASSVIPFLFLTLSSVCSSNTGAEIPAFTEEGFRVPQPQKELQFPRDHGSHPDYKIEWWYFTGHLETETGQAFGFQATFFRFAAPRDRAMPDHPEFGNSQLFSSQVALTDVEGNQFTFDERLDRNGWDASAAEDKLSIRHGPWKLEMQDDGSEQMNLEFSIRDRAQLDLHMRPTKPKVIFGEDGTSRKGPDEIARSYYITFPRLETTGTIVLNGETLEVKGEAWMDHEIASQQLSSSLEGWDWTAIQLEDGREIKAYVLRQQDGSASPYSRFIWINQEGELQYILPANFEWERTKSWKSPYTDTDYPNTVVLKAVDPLTGNNQQWKLVPKIDHQEVRGDLNGTYYWEGACDVLDVSGKRIGQAYLELAGYHDSLGDKLR